MSDSMAGVNQMVSDLNKSINAAIDKVKAQQADQASAAANAQNFQKNVKKSAMNTPGAATDIGVLAKGTTRLNVVSSLAAKDTVDFYKFRVTTKGEVTLGQIGDSGIRLQVMTKLGSVVADSDKTAGKEYENFKSMMQGTYSLDKGDYTIRITRNKGESDKTSKNYAIQLSMGKYTKDFDTVAKQPGKNDNPFQMSEATQTMLSGLNNAANSLASSTFGQSGTQKLLGSFNLFV